MGLLSNRSRKTQDVTESEDDNFDEYRETEDEMNNLNSLITSGTIN